jgi:hypothetical protein
LIAEVMIQIRAKLDEQAVVGHAYEPIGRFKPSGDEVLKDQ